MDEHKASGGRTKYPLLDPDLQRFWLAMALIIGVLAITLIGLLRDETTESIAQLLAPVIGLAGTAVGYLFGGGTRAKE